MDTILVKVISTSQACLHRIRCSKKQVGVANGGMSTGKHVTKLTFQHTGMSEQAAEADTFNDFPS